MITWLRDLWRQWNNSEGREKAEVDQIAVLQRAAQQRRAEHAEHAEQTEQPGLTVSRKRVQEAEAAHAAALQAWNNKQFRYRVR